MHNDINNKLKEFDRKLSIAQIIPMLENTNILGNLVKLRYNKTLMRICDKLNINLYTECITSSPYDLYRDSKAAVVELNTRHSINGIMYDCPFVNDKFGGSISSMICQWKDIECITPSNIGTYITKQQFESIPPLITSMEMMIDNYSTLHANRIGIVKNIEPSNYTFIPGYNPNTYYVTSLEEPTFVDDMTSMDIIVSYKYNTSKRIDENIIIKEDKVYPKLVLDYGWTPKEYLPSIEKDLFLGGPTKYFSLYDGLIELYIYNSIDNMIRMRNMYTK